MYLTISNNRELLRFHNTSVVCIQSEGNYSTFFLSGGVKEVVGMQLGQVEELIGNQLHSEAQRFVRIGRSLIVNRDLVYKIIPSEGILMLRNGDETPIKTPQVSTEALRKFKDIIEKGF